MQHDAAAVKRGQALGELRRFDGAASQRAVAAKVSETLGTLNLGTGSTGLLNRARRALSRNDFMRAVGLANEALALKTVERHNLRERAAQELASRGLPEADYYKTLNGLAREHLRDAANRDGAPRHGGTRAYYALQTLNAARNSVMHAGTGLAGQQPPNDLLSPEALRALLEWSFRFYDFLD